MISASSRFGDSTFWKAHHAGEVFRRSPASESPEDLGASVEAITRAVSVASAQSDSLGHEAWEHYSRELEEVRDDSGNGRAQGGGGDGRGGTGQSGSTSAAPKPDPWEPEELVPGKYGRKCCVVDFKYPSEYKRVADPVGIDFGILEDLKKRSTIFVGVRFEAWAEYSPAGNCDCTCCEFKQFVKLESIHKDGTGSGEFTAQDFDFHEDCKVKSGPNAGALTAPGVPPGVRSTPRKDLFCYGMRDEGNQLPPPKKGEDGSDDETMAEYKERVKDMSGANAHLDGGCEMFMVDTPGIVTYPRVPFSYDVTFKGEIRDKCPMHLNKLLEEESFKFILAGTVTKEGKFLRPTYDGSRGTREHGPLRVQDMDEDGNFAGFLDERGNPIRIV